MDLRDIKKKLTDEDIIRFMAHLGSHQINNNNPNELVFQTICHHKKHEEMKYKLYYYKNSKKFFCYSSCGNIGDIFNLTSQVLKLDAKESVKYILKFFNVDMSLKPFEEEDYGFGEDEEEEEDIIFHSIKLEDIEVEPLPSIKRQGIMKVFVKYYCKDWINEGISIKTMQKYDIRFSPERAGIIIPHHNINGEIVGVRIRNLENYAIEHFGKYTPLYLNGKLLSHKLSANLFGLDKNKEAIKKFKKVQVFESEKAVLQSDTFFGNNSIAVAICGSSFNRIQMKMLIDLGVEEVIMCLDKQYDCEQEEIEWSNKIKRMCQPLLDYGLEVTTTWDTLHNGLLDYKNAPTDKGLKVFKELVKNRIKITNEEKI